MKYAHREEINVIEIFSETLFFSQLWNLRTDSEKSSRSRRSAKKTAEGDSQ